MSDTMDIDAPSSGFHAGLSKLLASGQFADMIITCQGREFKVHKAIVCSQSAVLLNAFKPGGFKESVTGVIDLPDDEPTIVEAMIRFMYEYKIVPPTSFEDAEAAPQFCTQLFLLADKYDIQPIIEQITPKFKRLLSSKNLDWVCNAAKATYAREGTQELRSAVVDYIHEHLNHYLQTSDFEKVMTELGGLGADIIWKMHVKAQDAERSRGYVHFVCDEDENSCNLEFMVNVTANYGMLRAPPFDMEVGTGQMECECPGCGCDRSVVNSVWSERNNLGGDRDWHKYECNYGHHCPNGGPAVYCAHRGRERDLDDEGSLPNLWCPFCKNMTLVRVPEDG